VSDNAYFQVDPRLATLLSEGYRSSEYAIKELVDNAWDADAEHVWVTLPEPNTIGAIVIKDDGTGMTEKEVRSGYLLIASDRRSRKGEITPLKHRKVKGRKGIGKFAGLMAANVMAVKTTARGTTTQLQICRDDLIGNRGDLESIPLPIATERATSDEKGTTVTLTDLNQNLAFPNPDKLRQILVIEYGREQGFQIYVNGGLIGLEDVPGNAYRGEADLPGIGPVRIDFKVAEGTNRLKQSGVVIRVGGKIVGPPSYLGLEDDKEIPPKLLKRIYGEIQADGLADDVTADWGSIIENSIGYQRLKEWAGHQMKAGIEESFSREVNLQKARLQQEINRRLAELPEYRREFAQRALDKILNRFFGESEEKVRAIVSVVLDAFEKDEYWTVLREVEQARRRDVETFAEALEMFGLVDVANIARQARARLKMLDELEALVCNHEALEKEVHQALERNLWVFGPEYGLMASNQTIRRVIRHYLDREFTSERAGKRPDLLMARDGSSNYLLIELKRPSHAIGRDDEAQALKYRDDLGREFSPMNIIVVGGRLDTHLDRRHDRPDVKLTTFNVLIENARAQLDWLVAELEKPYD